VNNDRIDRTHRALIVSFVFGLGFSGACAQAIPPSFDEDENQLSESAGAPSTSRSAQTAPDSDTTNTPSSPSAGGAAPDDSSDEQDDEPLTNTPIVTGTEDPDAGGAPPPPVDESFDAGPTEPEPECEVPSDCDDDNPCTNDLCQSGNCAHSNAAGNCPDDGDECTSDVCAAGTCTHPSNNSCGGSCAGIPAWDEDQDWTAYSPGDQHTHASALWQCHTPGWCYIEPGSTNTALGWTSLGGC
jgi:hypothetical protein